MTSPADRECGRRQQPPLDATTLANTDWPRPAVEWKARGGADGLHLFNRKTGVNVLLDEISIEQTQWARAPRQVSMALTNACDLACAYCYAPKHAAVLDADTVCAWAQELDIAGTFGLGFGGGEPTLHRRLAQICQHIAKHTQLAVTMTTHAHRWTPLLVDALQGSVHFVRVSVDGTGDVYERLRQRPFATLVEKLELIGGTFPFGINCVVNNDTINGLDAVAHLADTTGAGELLLLPERGVAGRGGASSDVIAELTAWVQSYRGPVRLALGGDEPDTVAFIQPLPSETGLCSYAHVDATGTLRRSSYDQLGETIGTAGVLDAIGRLENRNAA